MTESKPTARAGAHRARGPDVPRHHLGRLGLQLAGHKIPARRAAAADAARLHRRDRRGPAGGAGAGARARACASARELWPRLVLAALLNVTGWMVLMGLALLWLPASEAALIAYTMPVWASMLAWPVLGERPTLLRMIALVMAFAGLAAIMGGNGFTASAAKLPGILMALARRDRLCARHRARQETAAAAAADPGRRLADRARLFSGRDRRALLIETTHLDKRRPSSAGGCWSIRPLIQFCIAYVSWFAALARSAGLGRGDRHHGGAGDRRGRVRRSRCTSRSGSARSWRWSSRWPASCWRRGRNQRSCAWQRLRADHLRELRSCDRALSAAARPDRGGRDARSRSRYSPRCRAPSCRAGASPPRRRAARPVMPPGMMTSVNSRSNGSPFSTCTSAARLSAAAMVL